MCELSPSSVRYELIPSDPAPLTNKFTPDFKVHLTAPHTKQQKQCDRDYVNTGTPALKSGGSSEKNNSTQPSRSLKKTLTA